MNAARAHARTHARARAHTHTHTHTHTQSLCRQNNKESSCRNVGMRLEDAAKTYADCTLAPTWDDIPSYATFVTPWEDSDQTAHKHSLIRVCAVRLKYPNLGSWLSKDPSEDWSDRADALIWVFTSCICPKVYFFLYYLIYTFCVYWSSSF